MMLKIEISIHGHPKSACILNAGERVFQRKSKKFGSEFIAMTLIANEEKFSFAWV